MAETEIKFAAKKCSCKSSRVINDPNLKAILPVGYKYSLCEIKYMENTFFESRIRIDISTKEDALKWLDEFMILSNTIFKKSATFPEDTQSNIYRVKMRCHHNTRPTSKLTSKRSKHTNCPSRLSLTVKKSLLSRRYESKDIHLKEFPTVVSLYHAHNHPLDPDNAMQYRQPNSEVIEKFLNMFESGLTPSKALSKHIDDLKALFGDDDSFENDGTICPKKRWVYSLHASFKKKLGTPRKDEMLSSLETFVQKYNEEQKGIYAELKTFDDGNFAIVILTPIMKRVLVNIPETSEVLYVDSVGNIERNGCKIWFLLTNSWCGELPVGCIITTSEREEVLFTSLETYQSFLNKNSFGGRGPSGPKVIMTGLRKSERSSFLKFFPESLVLLCISQTLQASWRYIMNSHSSFPFDKQPELFLKIKDLIYSSTKAELMSRYDDILESYPSNDYERFVDYVKKLYARREEWATCFRTKLKLKEESDRVICEASIKFMKEGVLKQTRINSVVPLFDFIVSDLENFYENKLVSFSNGQKPTYLKSTVDCENLSIISSNQLGPKCFHVLNEKSGNVNFVDLHAGLCSCNIGQTGAVCSHQLLASMKYNIKTVALTVTTDPLVRKILFFVATGKDLPSSWFGVLHPESENEVDFNDDENEIYIEMDHNAIKKEDNEDEVVYDVIKREEEDDDDKNVYDLIKVEAVHDQNNYSVYDSCSLDKSSENGDMMGATDTQTLENLQMTFNQILNQVSVNSELLHASKKFVKNFESIQSNNDLAVALSTFGNCV